MPINFNIGYINIMLDSYIKNNIRMGYVKFSFVSYKTKYNRQNRKSRMTLIGTTYNERFFLFFF